MVEPRGAASTSAARAVGVVGSLSLDRIVEGRRTSLRLGGVVSYAGLSYRLHGLRTHVVCNVARADRGLLEPLRAAGLELHLGPTEHTTRFVNRVRGDRRRQEVDGRARPIEPRLARALDGCALLHLGPLYPGDLGAGWARAAERLGARVALDIQGLTREIRGRRVVPGFAGTERALLARAEFLKGDEAEVEVLAAALGAHVDAIPGLTGARELVVTRGSRGGWVVGRGGRAVRYQVPRVERGDPTGAGDVFFAAYLVGRLWRGWGAGRAARRAADIAARQVAGRHLPPGALAIGPPGR